MESQRTAVERLMTSGVLTVDADVSVADAAARMVTEGVGSVVVVDEGRPVGMFTTTDLAEFVSADGSTSEATVSEYMTDEVVTVTAGTSLQGAAAKMIRHQIHHLPVTDEAGDVVGMLSTMDVTAHSSFTDAQDMV